MSPDENGARRPDARRSLERDVSRLRRREGSGATFWRSLSVIGAVGWPIALGTVGGALLGRLLDARLGTGIRFTLMLLTAGVLLGSFLAWKALGRERP